MSMEFGPKPEEIRKINESRAQYEKQTKKDASKTNTFLENITGEGLKKEDIMHVDAEIEDGLHSKIKSNEINDIDANWLKDTLAETQKSTLTFDTKYRYSYEDGSNIHRNKFKLEGLIAGKKVSINGVSDTESELNIGEDNILKISGSVDGKTLTKPIAIEILAKYMLVAERRTYDMKKLHEKIDQQRKAAYPVRLKEEQMAEGGEAGRIEEFNKKEELALAEKNEFKDIL